MSNIEGRCHLANFGGEARGATATARAATAASIVATKELHLPCCSRTCIVTLVLLLLSLQQQIDEACCSLQARSCQASNSRSSSACCSKSFTVSARRRISKELSHCDFFVGPHTAQQQQQQSELFLRQHQEHRKYLLQRPQQPPQQEAGCRSRDHTNWCSFSFLVPWMCRVLVPARCGAAAAASAAAVRAGTAHPQGASIDQRFCRTMPTVPLTASRTAEAADAKASGAAEGIKQAAPSNPTALSAASPRPAVLADIPLSAAKVRTVCGASISVVELSFPLLDSTQKWAERHLDELVSVHLQQRQQQHQGTWCLCITATRQTAGVGTRRGDTGEERRWVSAAGNLHATYLLPWKQQQQRLLLYLPFVAALSVQRVLQQLGIACPQIKWVNDVLVNNKKIAGVLCQNTNRSIAAAVAAAAGPKGSAAAEGAHAPDDVVVLMGVGLNLVSHPMAQLGDCCYQGSTDVREALQQQQQQQCKQQQQHKQELLRQCNDLALWPPPSSRLLTSNNHNINGSNDNDSAINNDLSVEGVLGLLHEQLGKLLMLLLQQGFPPFRTAIAEHLAYLGERVSLMLDGKQQQQQEKYSGIVEGLGNDGSLLLRLPDGSLQGFTSGRLIIDNPKP